MEKYTAITSMDQSYYDKCGKAMLSSYKHNGVNVFPLNVYNEDNFNVKVKAVNPVGWDLGQDYINFMSRHTNTKVKTFAKKGFSIIHAMKHTECERLIWLDADTLLKKEMPVQLLDLIAPDDVLSTHFSVWHEKDGKIYHSCETGFFILNKQHPGYNDFVDTYNKIYCNNITDHLRRFYDGEVYGRTVDLMAAKGHKMLNLNPKKHKTPISRSVIAPYIDHYKAGLKERIDFNNIEQVYED